MRESSPGRGIVRAKVLGRESSKEKCQEGRIAALNKDTLLRRHGIPSRTTHPEANDYVGPESPQTVFPASYPSDFSCLLFLLTRSPHSWGHPVKLTTPSNVNKTRIASTVRKALSTFIHNSEATANVPQ